MKNRIAIVIFSLATLLPLMISSYQAQAQIAPQAIPRSTIAFPFKAGDRVQWIGSSSTHIGTWPRTMQFLLRTRHPQLNLSFESSSTGGGTFVTGLENADKWLGDFKPTLVFLNYGGNDATEGEAGLPQFKTNMDKLVAKVQGQGARVVLMTPQAGDARKSSIAETANRKLYAETMLAYKQQQNLPVADVFHPLEALQTNAQADDQNYTINIDHIHLTHSAYIAWGYFLYQALNPPPATSAARISARGRVRQTQGCKISDVKVTPDGLSFTRADAILPILPPVPQNQPYPPRKYVPLEELSLYLLTVTGLKAGRYEILCEGQSIGTVEAKALAAGVNLNSVLLDAGHTAPWDQLAHEIWDGKSLDKIGHTIWHFEIKRQP